MLTLPDGILPVLNPFATLFRTPTWRKAQILLVGAVLAPGQRTVASALRVMGLSGDRNYARYHHVLNRAAWSPLQAAHILLNLLIQFLDQGDGPLVFGIDETVERRGGPKISARGIYRDAVRSSRSGVPWEQVSAAWYDGATRTVEIISQTAVWYHTGKPPVPIRWVLIRDPQGEFAPQALLCTGLAVAPAQIMEWFVLRWQLEVTFHETRAHLGVGTQRQWSDRAIARTTPILMGLFSWVTLAAHLLQQQHPIIHRTAAWYAKPDPTFADAIALMRRHLWIASGGGSLSVRDSDSEKPPASLYDRLIDTLAYAA